MAGGAFKKARSHFAADLGERSNQCELAPALRAVRLILVFGAGLIHGGVDIAEMEPKRTPGEPGKIKKDAAKADQGRGQLRPC